MRTRRCPVDEVACLLVDDDGLYQADLLKLAFERDPLLLWVDAPVHRVEDDLIDALLAVADDAVVDRFFDGAFLGGLGFFQLLRLLGGWLRGFFLLGAHGSTMIPLDSEVKLRQHVWVLV
jgi:hypothetical protein